MGQVCPLPERIPKPYGKELKKMQHHGITVNLTSGKVIAGVEYVTYELPEGWSMKDDSWRADLPEWYIVDQDSRIHFRISGSWKETYDNHLSIKAMDGSKKYKPKADEPIPSETTADALLGKALDVAGDNIEAQKTILQLATVHKLKH